MIKMSSTKPITQDQVIDVSPFIKLLGCDTARISIPFGKYFLIIGTRKRTKDDRKNRQWCKNNGLTDFEYIEERVVASGDTLEELMESARGYKRLITGKRNIPNGRC